MTNKDSLKRLWVEFNKLKNWAHSTNPIEFTVEICSLDEEDETTPTSANNNIVTITGLIYPSTEPFTQWGLRIEIHVPITYPQKGPEVYMKMNIRHPNIDKNGKIWCSSLDSLQPWKSFSLSTAVELATKTMDRPESSYIRDAEMYTLYETNYTEYNRKMKEMVANYGVRRPEGSINTDSSKTSLGNDRPPKDAAQQLLQYLDILYPNGVSINTVLNSFIIDGNTVLECKPEVTTFFQTVGTYAVDYNCDLVEMYKMTLDANKIATANWTEIKQMLSCMSRAEKFSTYNNMRAIESGRVKWILLRLKQLVEQ